jgi:DNA-binding response OmpR family regulator
MSLGRILLIDDDADIKAIYQEILQEAGYQLESYKDGSEGYAKILEGGYDLILIDIMMPKTDGISVLKKLHENPNPPKNNGPIYVISQLDHDEVVKGAIALGANGYIVKSNLNPQDVVTKVGEILKKQPVSQS